MRRAAFEQMPNDGSENQDGESEKAQFGPGGASDGNRNAGQYTWKNVKRSPQQGRQDIGQIEVLR